MCLTVQKQNPDGRTYSYLDTLELSCGWGIFPLYTMDGTPVENKTYDLKLHGGTPFEKDVGLLGPFESKGLMSSFFPAQKPPRLSIRVWKMSQKALGRLK